MVVVCVVGRVGWWCVSVEVWVRVGGEGEEEERRRKKGKYLIHH